MLTNNSGESFIIGLVDFAGGAFWIYDAGGKVPMTVVRPVPGWPELEVGKTAYVTAYPVKHQCVRFNGFTPHATQPPTGCRYTLVLFYDGRLHECPCLRTPDAPADGIPLAQGSESRCGRKPVEAQRGGKF